MMRALRPQAAGRYHEQKVVILMARSLERSPAVKIVLAVLAVLLVLALGTLAFAGNYMFTFALDPHAPGGMIGGDQGSALDGDAAWLQDSSEDRWLTSRDGLTLHGLYVPQEGSHRYAVLCHGYGSVPQTMGASAVRFHDMGFHVLAPAARAHGRSEGRYVSMGWLEREDIVDWVGTITAQDPQAEIVLFGISMGGATVMMTAGEELPANVKCIIEDCGYSSVWDEFAVQLQDMFGLPTFPVLDTASLVCQIRAGYSFKQASAVEQLEKASLPMLFIHGEEDAFVPYSMLDVVYGACASPEKERLSVPGAAHGEAASADPELYWSTVEAFLAKHMG